MTALKDLKKVRVSSLIDRRREFHWGYIPEESSLFTSTSVIWRHQNWLAIFRSQNYMLKSPKNWSSQTNFEFLDVQRPKYRSPEICLIFPRWIALSKKWWILIFPCLKVQFYKSRGLRFGSPVVFDQKAIKLPELESKFSKFESSSSKSALYKLGSSVLRLEIFRGLKVVIRCPMNGWNSYYFKANFNFQTGIEVFTKSLAG